MQINTLLLHFVNNLQSKKIINNEKLKQQECRDYRRK